MKFRYSLLQRSTSYWLVLGVFAAANLWSFLRFRLHEPECCDQVVAAGFPFPFMASGGIDGASNFYVTGLLLDLAIAWTIAVSAAWIALHWRQRGTPD